MGKRVCEPPPAIGSAGGRTIQKWNFLRAEEYGLSVKYPTFTNLSAVLNRTNRAEGWRHIQMKGGQHGSQLRKTVQPPRHPTVPRDSGIDPGGQLGRRLFL